MSNAQDSALKKYDWDEKAAYINVPEQYKNEKEVILERNTKVQIATEQNKGVQYYLFHEKTFLNSDDAVERNNKIYLPFRLDESVLLNKARVILKNGKTVTLNAGDIKEEVDEERGMKYNYFAVNGLEKGAVIERIFLLSESPELNGKTVHMQGEYPIVKNTFELSFPSHLTFKTKSYNGLAEAAREEKTDTKTTILTLKGENLSAFDDSERYSNQNSAMKLFRYKLDSNLASGAKNMYNFKEFATNVYDRLHPEYSKKELKAIDDFCKDMPKSTNPQEQIWNIENKLKKTINYSRYIDDQKEIQDILKSRQANQVDLLRVYVAVFSKMDIENQLVMTSNRYKVPFDKEFESYENLSELLFYFPSIKKFLTPTEVEYRIPLFPAELASNNGLFIKSRSFGGMNTGIGEINFIEVPGTDITHDVMEITIDFSKDISNPIITDRISFGGYSAMNFQPVKDFSSAEDYKTLLKEIAKNYTVDTQYKTLTAENDGTEFIGKKPFVLNVTFEGKDLVKKAGESYLFSAGQVIGRQMELYQETKRLMPVEIDYPHSYTRTIKIITPKGTVIKNLEKFNMDYKALVNGKTEAAFTSKFELKDNIITVDNIEYYNVIHYPLSIFEEYRSVINAAADFNKIVLILGK
ncbi:DUF3857 domain-containing protein [Flavobacterium sp. MAH-1]|uniref:DUF3857 domain-containing protein n=1 Tax=Flavobacterium agri TaxID=2743471 RepID=A0A7Y8Y1I1_9FLAO|nr:DUF3857 domain-containing protein [Flavobacterium agri]NUY80707.1 DUF3857 domain-containing protein [Flavobacterium agri]NYA70731.1 DUF3857 domain-containing protein [Flavobacterium agri]